MINIKHLLKVSMIWISVVYVICFVGVALFPGVQDAFMKYALHTESSNLGQNYLTFGSFVSGLVVWNIIMLIGVWFFAVLFNKIKE